MDYQLTDDEIASIERYQDNDFKIINGEEVNNTVTNNVVSNNTISGDTAEIPKTGSSFGEYIVYSLIVVAIIGAVYIIIRKYRVG